jgi:putative OPT family oligopeptide transporter
MTIATLLAVCLIFVKLGWTGAAGKIAAISIGAIVCVGISTAADISQDLKTGFLLGATPKKQQLSEFVGVLTSAAVIGFVIIILHESFGIGSSRLPAPQANLMKMVVEGVMDKNLPWALVLTGVSIAIVVELLGVPSLPFAVGLYLPVSLSTPIMIGGILRLFVERDRSPERVAKRRESGVLFSSGMIAGGASLGVLLALYMYLKDKVAFLRDLPEPLIGNDLLGATGAQLLSLAAFAALAVILWRNTKS